MQLYQVVNPGFVGATAYTARRIQFDVCKTTLTLPLRKTRITIKPRGRLVNVMGYRDTRWTGSKYSHNNKSLKQISLNMADSVIAANFMKVLDNTRLAFCRKNVTGKNPTRASQGSGHSNRNNTRTRKFNKR